MTNFNPEIQYEFHVENVGGENNADQYGAPHENPGHRKEAAARWG